MSFEQDIARMEEITKKLQDNTTSLDDSISLFEEGVAIAQKVEKSLTEIERKVEILLTPPDSPDAKPTLESFPQK